jgi:2-hydroxy-6-oxonona-2,4-dienedioate hydrolase
MTASIAELTRESTSRTVSVAAGELHYHEAGSGHPVILLHGSGPGATGWSNFSRNIGPLAEHFHVYAVDMPGWGESHAVSRDEVDHPESLRQFMDALGIERAALVGNSMGGVTVMAMAIKHRERVSHAITMGSGHMQTPKLFGAGDGPTEGLKVLFAAYADPTPENMFRLVDVMTYGPEHATEELARARSEATLARPDHVQNFLEGLPKGGPVREWFDLEALRDVQIPTLLLHGRDDRVVPYEDSLHFVARIPNSRLVLVNRCGHWLMIEHADEFNRLVTEFVQNN